MTGSDLHGALLPVVEALEAMGVRYYIGGSVASSLHGVPRASVDADVIAELATEHVAPLAARLRDSFYLDEDRMRHSVERHTSFHLIHLATMFKVDVFDSKGRPFDVEAFERSSVNPLSKEPYAPSIRVASAEDTLLAKLEWFRRGGETSERQWADVSGLLRARAGQLDVTYLRRWASSVGVADLLERALSEASEQP